MPRPNLAGLYSHLTARARTLWRAVLPIPAVLLPLGLTLGFTEQTYRLAGLALQLLGIGLVARSLSKTLQDFGRQPPMAAAQAWVAELLVHLGLTRRAPRHLILQPLGGEVRVEGGVVNFVVSGSHDVDSRLHALESNLASLRAQLDTIATDVRKRIDEVRHDLDQARETLAETDAALRKLLDSFAVGDSHWDIVGLVWLVAGTIFAGIPAELACRCLRP